MADFSTYCEDPFWDSIFIYARHRGVCKFDQRDSGYERVIDKLRCYVETAKEWNRARIEKLKRELDMEDSDASCESTEG